MREKNPVYYTPRNYNSIGLWRDVTNDQWYDPGWQRKNTIRSADQLKQVIRLNPYQESEINRTLDLLKTQGKESMRITPYYASLMQEDPFNPVMLPGEKSGKRLDPIFWQCVPTPANLLFPNLLQCHKEKGIVHFITPVETTHRTKLPLFESSRKSKLLGYQLYDKEMPLTNPAVISDKLDLKFKESGYFERIPGSSF